METFLTIFEEGEDFDDDDNEEVDLDDDNDDVDLDDDVDDDDVEENE